MKNRQITLVLLVMALLASLFMVTACVPSNAEIKVAITNKEALQEDWTAGEDARQLGIEVTVGGKAVIGKTYTVTTSDANVVSVGEDKLTLTAVGGGTATITVTVDETITDSVEITVIPALASVTVTNKEALQQEWTDWTAKRTVQVGFAPAYYTGENTTATVTATPADVLKIEGYKLTAVKVGEATVTVAVGELIDTFTVKVSRKTPEINFEELPDLDVDATTGNAKYATVEGDAVSLNGLYEVSGSEGNKNLTVDIETKQGDPIEYDAETNTVTASKQGSYVVTISVADKLDSTKVAEKTITIEYCRKLYSWKDDTWKIDALNSDEDQTVTNTKGGYQMLSFNMEPSRYYYAEVTYKGTTGDGWMGMAHYKTETLQDEEGKDYSEENHKRILVHAVAGYSNHDYQNIDYDTNLSATIDGSTVSGWAMLGQEWNDEAFGTNYFFHQYRLEEFRNLTPATDGTINKLAILRMGDYFMFFFNDQYVNTSDLRWYAEGDTRPGLYAFGKDNGSNIGTITNISYFGGETEVKAKYNALTDNGAKLIVNYIPDSGWAGNSKNVNNDHFTLGTTTTEKGINFTNTGKNWGFNDSMISTYMLFDGDFTFSWVYKQTSNTNSGEPRMALEVRNYKYGAERTLFGVQYQGNGGSRWLFNTPTNPEDGTMYWEDKGYDGDDGSFDITRPLKFTISRKLYDTYSEYTMTTCYADNGVAHTKTRTIKVSAQSDSRWAKPVLMHWKTSGVDGEFSNIMWKNYNGQGNWVD